MNTATLPSCSHCRKQFWPTAGQANSHCPECVSKGHAPLNIAPRMSHLPQPVSGNTVSVRPRELPGMPLPGKSASEIEFDNIRGKVAPQILFSCPACMTMLALKSGFQVSGNALPCPYCATAIMPPQLFVPQGNISSKTSNVWKIGERKDSKKMYRPPRDNANVVFLKERPETAATSH